jgi:hypothetical protein
VRPEQSTLYDPLLERARELLDLTPALVRYAREVARQACDTRACSWELRQQMADLAERQRAARSAGRRQLTP